MKTIFVKQLNNWNLEILDLHFVLFFFPFLFPCSWVESIYKAKFSPPSTSHVLINQMLKNFKSINFLFIFHNINLFITKNFVTLWIDGNEWKLLKLLYPFANVISLLSKTIDPKVIRINSYLCILFLTTDTNRIVFWMPQLSKGNVHLKVIWLIC